ncbi:DMT family transporter [Glycomyces terrestris]|uniref:QacE family quaternary ammonium compound efflux SMR transporter n=1 Tax=Glycomyces terrestris TaxID=2493553 RepID=A0A426V1M4_9ACTN|nr:SMR family transporter [Glycomyces terrestris]RRS00737.1 QacE family quaternary ammonium compound efflux SMR transporter [Glycomyces terrestris]
MAWVFLIGAILSEVAASLSLKAASDGRKGWYAVVAAGYGLAFTSLTFALDRGLGIGVAYGIWVAAGVALTAVGGRLLFKEPLSKLMAFGIALVGAGVLLVEIGGH